MFFNNDLRFNNHLYNSTLTDTGTVRPLNVGGETDETQPPVFEPEVINERIASGDFTVLEELDKLKIGYTIAESNGGTIVKYEYNGIKYTVKYYPPQQENEDDNTGTIQLQAGEGTIFRPGETQPAPATIDGQVVSVNNNTDNSNNNGLQLSDGTVFKPGFSNSSPITIDAQVSETIESMTPGVVSGILDSLNLDEILGDIDTFEDTPYTYENDVLIPDKNGIDIFYDIVSAIINKLNKEENGKKILEFLGGREGLSELLSASWLAVSGSVTSEQYDAKQYIEDVFENFKSMLERIKQNPEYLDLYTSGFARGDDSLTENISDYKEFHRESYLNLGDETLLNEDGEVHLTDKKSNEAFQDAMETLFKNLRKKYPEIDKDILSKIFTAAQAEGLEMLRNDSASLHGMLLSYSGTQPMYNVINAVLTLFDRLLLQTLNKGLENVDQVTLPILDKNTREAAFTSLLDMTFYAEGDEVKAAVQEQLGITIEEFEKNCGVYYYSIVMDVVNSHVKDYSYVTKEQIADEIIAEYSRLIQEKNDSVNDGDSTPPADENIGGDNTLTPPIDEDNNGEGNDGGTTQPEPDTNNPSLGWQHTPVTNPGVTSPTPGGDGHENTTPQTSVGGRPGGTGQTGSNDNATEAELRAQKVEKYKQNEAAGNAIIERVLNELINAYKNGGEEWNFEGIELSETQLNNLYNMLKTAAEDLLQDILPGPLMSLEDMDIDLSQAFEPALLELLAEELSDYLQTVKAQQEVMSYPLTDAADNVIDAIETTQLLNLGKIANDNGTTIHTEFGLENGHLVFEDEKTKQTFEDLYNSLISKLNNTEGQSSLKRLGDFRKLLEAAWIAAYNNFDSSQSNNTYDFLNNVLDNLTSMMNQIKDNPEYLELYKRSFNYADSTLTNGLIHYNTATTTGNDEVIIYAGEPRQDEDGTVHLNDTTDDLDYQVTMNMLLARIKAKYPNVSDEIIEAIFRKAQLDTINTLREPSTYDCPYGVANNNGRVEDNAKNWSGANNRAGDGGRIHMDQLVQMTLYFFDKLFLQELNNGNIQTEDAPTQEEEVPDNSTAAAAQKSDEAIQNVLRNDLGNIVGNSATINTSFSIDTSGNIKFSDTNTQFIFDKLCDSIMHNIYNLIGNDSYDEFGGADTVKRLIQAAWMSAQNSVDSANNNTSSFILKVLDNLQSIMQKLKTNPEYLDIFTKNPSVNDESLVKNDSLGYELINYTDDVQNDNVINRNGANNNNGTVQLADSDSNNKYQQTMNQLLLMIKQKYSALDDDIITKIFKDAQWAAINHMNGNTKVHPTDIKTDNQLESLVQMTLYCFDILLYEELMK